MRTRNNFSSAFLTVELYSNALSGKDDVLKLVFSWNSGKITKSNRKKSTQSNPGPCFSYRSISVFVTWLHTGSCINNNSFPPSGMDIAASVLFWSQPLAIRFYQLSSDSSHFHIDVNVVNKVSILWTAQHSLCSPDCLIGHA